MPLFSLVNSGKNINTQDTPFLGFPEKTSITLMRFPLSPTARLTRSTHGWSQLGLLLIGFLVIAGLTACHRSSRDPSLPYALDLKPFYHKVFRDVGGADSTYKGYSGYQIVDGLPFNVDGEIELYGKSDAERNVVQPDHIEGIKIGRKFDELHLIHAMQWREYYGCPVATIRLNYEDDTHSDFPIRCDFQVNDWNRLLTENEEIVADLDTKIIWRGQGAWKGTGRLFKSVLHNPFPDKMVKSMDIISTHSSASYTLAAATVAQSDPLREVTPPRPLYPSRQFDGSLNVLLLDRQTGAPVAGAEVYTAWVTEDVGLVGDPVRSSSNGIAVVKYPTGKTQDLRIMVSKTGYQTCDDNWGNAWNAESIPKNITYQLTPKN